MGSPPKVFDTHPNKPGIFLEGGNTLEGGGGQKTGYSFDIFFIFSSPTTCWDPTNIGDIGWAVSAVAWCQKIAVVLLLLSTLFLSPGPVMKLLIFLAAFAFLAGGASAKLTPEQQEDLDEARELLAQYIREQEELAELLAVLLEKEEEIRAGKADLEEKKKSTEDQINELEEKYNDVRETHDDLLDYIETLEEELLALEEAGKEEEAEEVREKIAEGKKRLNEIKEALADMLLNLRRLAKELKDLRARCEHLEAMLAELNEVKAGYLKNQISLANLIEEQQAAVAELEELAGECKYLDPECMKAYFYKSLEACQVDPPSCDTCTCPRIKSACDGASGWASGATLNNVSCCRRKDPAERYVYLCFITPNQQQRTLGKLLTELRCGNFCR